MYSDIKAVRDGVPGQVLKVILETGYLTKEQIVRGCILAKMAGADFVKTSTGFGPGGATAEDVALMRKVVGADCGVKASGGIRDAETAVAMIKAGANRLGASSGVAIMEGLRGDRLLNLYRSRLVFCSCCSYLFVDLMALYLEMSIRQTGLSINMEAVQ